MANATWNQDEYDEAKPRDYSAMPRGQYLTRIENSTEKQTNRKDGSYFEFELTVVKPQAYEGRKAWARLNVHNPSETAERIGREQYKALCVHAGKPNAKKTEMLHGKLVVAFLEVERNQNGDPTNRVNGFGPPSDFVDNDAADTPNPTPGQPAPTPGNPPPGQPSPGQQPPQPAPRARAVQQTEIEEDDVPF